MSNLKVAIVGTVGVPANYGGFETLAENLVDYVASSNLPIDVTVYCSKLAYEDRPPMYNGAGLKYLPLPANGSLSILFDMVSLVSAVRKKNDAVLLLGHGGSFILPVLKCFTNAKFFTNIDGIEWQREKWGNLARFVLRLSECFAIKHSHSIIADNEGIADYVRSTFGKSPDVISYGGEHAVCYESKVLPEELNTSPYALSLCRIEPENNVELILEAFSKNGLPLVFVGNWAASEFGVNLRSKYTNFDNLELLDPIYEPVELFRIRSGANFYIHGHSAGGTNPSLVEMMHFGIPILAFDCVYNRYTTNEECLFFSTFHDLNLKVHSLGEPELLEMGAKLKTLAELRYTWSKIGKDYFELIGKHCGY